MPSDVTISQSLKPECEAFSLQLAELADPRDSPNPQDGAENEVARVEVDANASALRHLDNCLRCQAELAQYRKLLRALAALSEQTITPDDDLLAEILVRVRPPAQVHRLHKISSNRKAAYLGGIAAAATGVTAGAFVLATKLALKQRLAS